jgi:hypothetical protein
MAEAKSEKSKTERQVPSAEKQKEIGKKVSESKATKIFGEIIGYAISLIFIFYVFPRLSFITDKYGQWQMIGFWATTIATFFNILKRASDTNFFQRIFEIANLLAIIYSTYKLIVIFPVDFSIIGNPQYNEYFRYLLIVLIAAMALAIIANFARIFAPETKKASSKSDK